jgi:hypothetical protein
MSLDKSITPEMKHSFLLNMPKSKQAVIEAINKLMNDY